MTEPSKPLLTVVAVRQLHAKRRYVNVHTAPYGWEVCCECGQEWPCATEKVIAELMDMKASDDGNPSSAQTEEKS